jgi:hypothetical protein
VRRHARRGSMIPSQIHPRTTRRPVLLLRAASTPPQVLLTHHGRPLMPELLA